MTDDPWTKVHAAYLDTLMHRFRLLAQRRGADEGSRRALTASIADHGRRLAELTNELVTHGGPAPLDRLRASAGLSSVEADVVALALAMELDAGLGALIDPDEHAPPPLLTPAVASEILGVPPTDTVTVLDSISPLRRFRLLAPDVSRNPLVHRPIRLELRVIEYLAGRNQIDPQLRGLVELVHPLRLHGAHAELADRLASWLGTPETTDARSRLNLVGRPGFGRTEVAAGIAQRLGLNALRVDLERLATRPDRIDLASMVVREALLVPAALIVEPPEATTDDPARAATTGELVADLDGLVMITSRHRWSTTDAAVAVHVPELVGPERSAMWRDALGSHGAAVDVDRLAAQFAFGPAGVDRAARELQARAEIGDAAAVTTAAAWAACRGFVGSDLGSLAQRIEPNATWDQLVLPDRDLAVLRQLAAQVDHRTRVYDEWGLGALMSRGRGISALFTGPPGTGKTMAAEVIAAELQLDLYRIDLASVVSKYIGETEKNLRRLFDAADQGGAILFFDEADALFGKRTEVKDSHDRHANVEINYLLQRIEDYAGLAVMATNRKGDLDPAFLRRIRFVVSFPFPRAAARARIWETVLPSGLPREALDLDVLARLELAGGNIRNAAVNAAFAAAAADRPVSMPLLVRAAAHEYAKLDKSPTQSEFGDYYDEVRL